MTLTTTRASLLRLNNTNGGFPCDGVVQSQGKQTHLLNEINGGFPIFSRGIGFDGHVNVNGTWKSFDKGFVNVNGTWKDLDELQTNINTTYKN